MAAPYRQRSPQLVLAADRKDEKWPLGLDRQRRIGRGLSMAQACKASKLPKQIEQSVFQHGGVGRNGPVRLANGAVSEEVALKESELEIFREVEDHIRQALLVSLATEAPGSQEPRGHHAVEIHLDAETVRVVIRPWLLAEDIPDDLAELPEERLVLAPKAQADLMLAHTPLGDVPAEEPHQFRRNAQVAIKDLVLMCSGDDLDVMTDTEQILVRQTVHQLVVADHSPLGVLARSMPIELLVDC